MLCFDVFRVRFWLCDIEQRRIRGEMENLLLSGATDRPAIAGEAAGFTVEQMIRLLNNRISVTTLLGLMAARINHTHLRTIS